MKKTFITILSVLYLVSGTGFTSVQYNCQNIQEINSPSEYPCCSKEVITESSMKYHLLEKPDANSCGAKIDTILPTQDDGKASSGGCCKVQHKHNHLDTSSLPLNIYVSQVADQSSGKYYYYPQNPQNIDGCALTPIADPLTHVNLPLLI
jgi:hypothetical protein